jgi:hypothetical protein
MKNLQGVLLLLASALPASVTAAALASGCGGDDSTPLPEAGIDATADGAMDTGADVNQSEDAPSEGASSDGGVEGAAGDGGGDAAPDSSAMFAFATQVAAAYCDRVANCCFGSADASAFNRTYCMQIMLPYGWDGCNQGTNVLDGGNVIFDPAKANSCLQDIAALDCAANTLTTAQNQHLLSDCFGALTGTLPHNAACADSIECAPGTFCRLANDGGPGVCTSLRGAGAPCGDFGGGNYAIADQACSYRGSGDTNVFCNSLSADAGDWSCTPAAQNDAGCFEDIACLSKVCDPGPNLTTNTCANATAFVYPIACPYFANRDGGTDAASDATTD